MSYTSTTSIFPESLYSLIVCSISSGVSLRTETFPNGLSNFSVLLCVCETNASIEDTILFTQSSFASICLNNSSSVRGIVGTWKSLIWKFFPTFGAAIAIKSSIHPLKSVASVRLHILLYNLRADVTCRRVYGDEEE